LPSEVKLPAYIISAATAGEYGYPKTQGYPPQKNSKTPDYSTPKYPKTHGYPPQKNSKTPDYSTPKYPKTPDYQTPKSPKTPGYPKTPPPDTLKYPPPPPPDDLPWMPFVPHPYEKKTPHILPHGKKSKKPKKREAKPEIAIGWKQRHELVMLEDFLGYKP